METPTRPAERMEAAGQPAPPAPRSGGAHYGDPEAEYRAALSGAVVVRRDPEGRVRALGRDRLDLLHRMSTNDLNSLPVGQARFSVLTTPVARMVDLLWVLNRGETALLLTGPGRAAAVRKWLAGYIFFRDQVKLEDASAELGQLGLYGPGAAPAAEALLPGAAGLAENHFLETDGLVVLRGRPLAGDGFSLLMPAAQMEAVWARVREAGAAPAGELAYQLLRLRAGRPEAGAELTEEYIPLEADLWSAVSFQKGCYIGQEIIARMESRGKLARRLMGLRLNAPVAPGAEVRVGQTTAGQVTSAGVLPDQGPVALAYLRTGQAGAGSVVDVAGVPGQVVELPFA